MPPSTCSCTYSSCTSCPVTARLQAQRKACTTKSYFGNIYAVIRSQAGRHRGQAQGKQNTLEKHHRFSVYPAHPLLALQPHLAKNLRPGNCSDHMRP